MKLYISPDLGTESSGNTVSKHELSAVESLGDKLIQIGYQHINPVQYGLPDNPFLRDYLTMDLIAKIDKRGQLIQDTIAFKGTIAMLYAGPFTNTIRYLKAKGIKTILSIDAHDREESIKEFENLGYEYPYVHVKNDDLWKIYNGGVHEADIVIVPSMASAKFLKREGVDYTKLRIIPHGINIPTTDKLVPIPGYLNDKFTVGYLGQYGPDKGIKYLIQAWSSLDYKDSALLFGGYYSKELEPFIKKYSTAGIFRLLGWINNLDTLYSMCSIYVQPSVTEAFGIEILEAMSYGKPVIASNGAGASDLIQDGVNGFIVNKRDPKAIADKIKYFRDNPKEVETMGLNARKTSLDYSWDKIKEQYVRVFTSI